jgi:tape measure domain-containing protein
VTSNSEFKIKVVADAKQGIQAFASLKNDVTKAKEELKKAQIEVTELARKLKEAPTPQLEREFSKAVVKAGSLKNEVNAGSVALEKMRRTLAAQGIDVTKLASSYVRLKKEAAEAADQQQRTAQLAVAQQDRVQRIAALNVLQQQRAEQIAAFAKLQQQRDNQITDSRSLLGIRSQAEIQAEINAVTSAYSRIKTSGVASQAELSRAATATRTKVRELTAELNNQANTTFTLANGVRLLAQVYVALQAAQIAAKPLLISDQYALLKSRIEVASGSAEIAGHVLDELNRIATKAQVPLEAVAAAYSKFLIGVRAQGLPLEEAIKFTEALSLALKNSGASAQETAQVMYQLGQSITKGNLNGDEFRTFAESAGKGMDYLSKALGVSVGELQKMAEQGKLTVNELIRLSEINGQINKDNEKVPRTLGGSYEVLINSIDLAISRSGSLREINNAISQGLLDQASRIDRVSKGQTSVSKGFVEQISNLNIVLLAMKKANIGGIYDEDLKQDKKYSASLVEQRRELADRLKVLNAKRLSQEKQLQLDLMEINRTALQNGKQAITEEIQNLTKLRDALISTLADTTAAQRDAQEKAADYRQRATGTRQSAADKILNKEINRKPDTSGLSEEDAAIVEARSQFEADIKRSSVVSDAIAKSAELRRKAAEALKNGDERSFERLLDLSDKQLERGSEFSDQLEDEIKLRSAIRDLAEQAAKNDEERANAEDKKAADAAQNKDALQKQLQDNETRLKTLNEGLATVEAALQKINDNTAIVKVDVDQDLIKKTKQQLLEVIALQAKINGQSAAQIKDPNFTGVFDSNGNAVFREPIQRAEGGPVFGERGRDKINAKLTYDEHVWTDKEVMASGGHSAQYRLRAMARSGALKRLLSDASGYAVGGAAGASLALRSAAARMSLPAFSGISGSGGRGDTINLTMPGFGTYQLNASRTTSKQLQSDIARAALMHGGLKE